MNAKHSPGPWSIGGKLIYKTVLMDANGNSIASGGNNRVIVGEQLEASLALAAAAPDLLAALRAILASGVRLNAKDDDAAYAAIAKAEGQQ
jgi:hypothetical protein